MLKKSHYIILLVVVLLVLALLQLPGGTMGKLKLAISGLFLALFGLAGSSARVAGPGPGDADAAAGIAAADGATAPRRTRSLGLRLQQESELWSENARLRAEAGWARQSPWRVKLARVIAREPANWWRSLEIDLGGARRTAHQPAGLDVRGRRWRAGCQSVGQTRSQVILLGDPNLRVAAVVATGLTNGETGVITANSSAPQDEGMIDLDYLSGNSAVRPGQSVVTWGVAGGVFPPGIPIGKIVDTRPKEYGLDHRGAGQTGGQPGRAGGSVGDASMNWRPSIFILAAAFLAVFLEAVAAI